ncbi:MAG: MoxR family ATPase [Syntrophorhabdaceae bacterium]|nr:MoxR family ATPase [Syntrophorhabdaceae bacterium]
MGNSLSSLLSNLCANIESILLGKREVIELAMASFLAGGHILLEDVPGTGKTTLAKALSAGISGSFRRVQFTGDLLPQDIIGMHILGEDRKSFVFSPGPLFANIVLADEINRGNPRSQSALLEAMSERQVTVDNRTYRLPDPFLVIATQNPYEQHGTYPLPESQLDRFNMRLRINYPDKEHETRLIHENSILTIRDGIPSSLLPDQIISLREEVNRVTVHDSLIDYIQQIASATRIHPAIRLGASPRSAIGLKNTAQALARIDNRDHVIPGDIRRAAPAVLSHRVFLKGASESSDAARSIIEEILTTVSAPL